MMVAGNKKGPTNALLARGPIEWENPQLRYAILKHEMTFL